MSHSRGRRRAPGLRAVRVVLPTASEQRCSSHRIVNVLDALPRKLQVRDLLTEIPFAEPEAEQQLQFQAWATGKGAAVTFYALPKEHRKALRTTHVVVLTGPPEGRDTRIGGEEAVLCVALFEPESP